MQNQITTIRLFLYYVFYFDQNTFLTAFKAINLARRASQAGSNFQNLSNMRQGNFSGFQNLASGFSNAVNSVGGTFHQAQNPSMIRINDLKNLMSYYINFLTLLPVNLLSQFGEGSYRVK